MVASKIENVRKVNQYVNFNSKCVKVVNKYLFVILSHADRYGFFCTISCCSGFLSFHSFIVGSSIETLIHFCLENAKYAVKDAVRLRL